MRKPFFKKSHSCWYVKNHACREIRLDPDEETAYRMWREMLDSASPVGPHVSFRRLAQSFKETHYEDKASFLQSMAKLDGFVQFIGLKAARDVTRQDMVQWLNADKPGRKRKDKETGEWIEGRPIKWAPRTKKDGYDAVSRVFRWATHEGILPRNPIHGLKLEAAPPRAHTITRAQYEQVMAATDPAFRLYLLACAATGTRPRQVREVEAHNVLPDSSAWVFHKHKTERTGKPLVVYLPPCLQTVTRILVAARPTGPLFLNSRGTPWRKDTVVKKINRLRKRLGLPNSVINYALRHTYATNSLLQGNSLQTVAELLGHADARMVSRVYGHLDQHRDHLLRAAMSTDQRRQQ